MKQKIAIISIILLLLFFVGCQKRDSIKIGFVGPLTGNYSSVGISSRNAINLAFEQFNLKGGLEGRPIELIVRDNKSKPKSSLAIVNELINEGITVIFGPTTSSSATELQSFYQREDLIFISSTVSSTLFDSIDDNHFRFISVKDRGEKVANYLIENNILKLLIVNDSTNEKLASTYIDDFMPRYSMQGGEMINIITYVPEENSAYGEIADEIIDEQPDGVIFLGDERNTALLCQQLQKREFETFLFTNAMTTSLSTHGGSSVEGMKMLTTFDSESEDRFYLQIKEEYEKRYSMEINFSVKRSYEASITFLDALKRDPEMTNLKASLLNRNQYPGLQGNLVMDRFGDVKREFYIYELSRTGVHKLILEK